jgi:hypothetical protein
MPRDPVWPAPQDSPRGDVRVTRVVDDQGVMTICPRCRAPHDSRRTTTSAADPLLLTDGARLCASCAPVVVEVVTTDDLAAEHDLAA